MSPDDKDIDSLKEELKEAIEKPDLAHTETKKTAAEMVLKLKCGKCNEVVEFPIHCDQQMELDGTTLTCDACSHKQEVDQHCGEPLKPFIAKA